METIQENHGAWPPPFSENDHLGSRRPSAPSLRTHIDLINQQDHRPSLSHTNSAPNAGGALQITPPDTPRESTTSIDAHTLPPPLFHNYLRALHPFDPQSGAVSGEDASLMNASLKEGDLVLVHCIHANGWADGTVLNTGDRGWLPTNYCEAYDHAYIRNLLNAMTQFWDLLGAGEDANLSTFVRQDYIRGLIAGVRYLLERADCLHRDAVQVQQHVGVRRMRKGLLADLSSLVGIAKRLQETIGEAFAGEVVHVLLDDLITKAFKVVTRAVSFVDVWTQESNKSRGFDRLLAPHAPATPPVDSTLRRSAENHLSPLVDSAVEIPVPTAEHPDQQADEPKSVKRDSGSVEDTPRISVVFTPPDGLAAHRLSRVHRESLHHVSAPLASDQLAKTHDICISHIAAFIGHHLHHSRPASELATTTDKLVRACGNMLTIVDEVQAHDPQNTLPVQQARKDFEARVDELASSTAEMFRFSDSADDEVIILPDRSQHLISVGTDLIRNTGECVVKTRQLIEAIGDFELKSPISFSPSPVQGKSEQDRSRAVQSECDFQEDSTAPSSPRKRLSIPKRMSSKMLPPPPPPLPLKESHNMVDYTDFAAVSPSDTGMTASPMTPETPAFRKSLPPPPVPSQRIRSTARVSKSSNTSGDALKSPHSFRSESRSPARKYSTGVSIAGSTDTFFSARDSSITTVSEASTRATTPEQPKSTSVSPDAAMMSSFASISSMRSLTTNASSEAEAQIMQKTYGSELTFNKDGQVTGGSLPALVEQLSTHDSAPDPSFVKAFFITFRKFSEPRELAQALIARYEYIGDSKTIGTPVRLRIFNVFKHWLETYWSPDADREALGEIRYFALHKLKHQLPSAGDRLIELTRRVAAGYRDGTIVAGVGRTTLTLEASFDAPEPAVNKHDLNSLRVANGGGAQCSVADFDPLEVARQITLMVAKTYCSIQPEEFLSMDWGKASTKKAKHVRQMCLMNTDLAHVVGDTILAPEDPKKRANVIKQWSKISSELLALNNFDSVMAIMCTINSSVVKRLKKTWEHVSKKTKARLDELEKLCDTSKNYSALRKRMDSPDVPSLPFLGVFLTDLTFVIAGNPKRREIPGSTSESGKPISVINFDMYMRIAKIIIHLQKFQSPYVLKDVPEMQTWLDSHFKRMREGHDQMVSTLHRRSLIVEPKTEDRDRKQSVAAENVRSTDDFERPRTAAGKLGMAQHAVMGRLDFILKNGA